MAKEYIRRRDSDGVEHYLDKQNEPESCVLCSIGMMWDMSRGQCGVTDETGYKIMSARFPGSLLWRQVQAALSGGDVNSVGGTTDPNIAQTLGAAGLIVTQTDTFNSKTSPHNYGFSWRKPRIRGQNSALLGIGQCPAMLGISWYRRTSNGLQGVGGHVVVASRVTSRGFVVILDPFDAGLYELHGSQGSYMPSYARNGQIGRIDLVLYTG